MEEGFLSRYGWCYSSQIKYQLFIYMYVYNKSLSNTFWNKLFIKFLQFLIQEIIPVKKLSLKLIQIKISCNILNCWVFVFFINIFVCVSINRSGNHVGWYQIPIFFYKRFQNHYVYQYLMISMCNVIVQHSGHLYLKTKPCQLIKGHSGLLMLQ